MQLLHLDRIASSLNDSTTKLADSFLNEQSNVLTNPNVIWDLTNRNANLQKLLEDQKIEMQKKDEEVAAAKEEVEKMKALMDMGFTQGVLAPQERPDIAGLRKLGFSGTDAQVIERAAKTSMPLLVASCSASSMWVANAATVSPSADTADGRVHFTAANLNCKYHRSIEHPTTSRVLGAMFANQQHFAHHAALPTVAQFGDEGAANHTRFCRSYGEAGVEFFVFGRAAFDNRFPAPQKYPARQTLEASQAVARLHGLSDEGVVYAQQNPAVIDQGVFHNDVIAVGNGEVLFSMANAVKPGVFDLDDIDHFSTRAVSFFLGLPGPRHPKQAFDVMVAAARKLAHELNGELKDDQRSVMTAQTIEHYRQRIVEFERRALTQRR